MRRNTMNYLNIKKRTGIIALMVLSVLSLCWTGLSCTFLKAQDKVTSAYELRMSGHADSAITVLNDIVNNEPDNALAYYELSRAKMHMMLGTGEYGIEEIIADAARANELDNDNAAFAYMEASYKFLDVYIQLMQGNEDIEEKLKLSVNAYEDVLAIMPCCPAVLITLTEIHSMLPEEMGGDKATSEHYCLLLESCDPEESLKAKALMLDNESDLLEYWVEAYGQAGENALISEELGRAYLMNGDIDNAKKYLYEAHSLKPEKDIVLIDLARAMMMQAMQEQDKELAGEALGVFEEYLEEYPDAPGPLKAYAYRMMAMVSGRILGNADLAEEYNLKKELCDPFCSRAFGAPSMALFVEPGVMPEGTGYYSRPF